MKALKIIGGVLAAIALAVFIFWFVALRAPDAKDVCENVARIMEKESGSKPPASFVEECIKDTKPPEFGRAPWVKKMKCYRDAETSKDLEACG
jgi:hypothetical protein